MLTHSFTHTRTHTRYLWFVGKPCTLPTCPCPCVCVCVCAPPFSITFKGFGRKEDAGARSAGTLMLVWCKPSANADEEEEVLCACVSFVCTPLFVLFFAAFFARAVALLPATEPLEGVLRFLALEEEMFRGEVDCFVLNPFFALPLCVCVCVCVCV
jgi:hypothetical protein